MKKTFSLAAAAALFAGAAAAAPLSPVTYSMINGDGQASFGSFNYWDINYDGVGAVSGAGPKTSDGEFLSGGAGDLTDGYIETQHWNTPGIENTAGTGPYVGWYLDSPVITFDFGTDVVIDEVTLHYDSGATGGVNAPASFSFGVQGGTPFSSGTLSNVAGPTSTTLTALNAAGSLFEMTIVSSGSWTFVSEVTFQGYVIGGTADVPVPAAAPLLLGALGAMGIAARRRRG
ncbi:VPLPA-CTERM sorting domain-containing protein [Rhodovulum sp. DZ06]|uniref:VPLPA-CTERM sorting domain-containing protein n=1 Tax=Rhodovulum sp. DZ06 TaxID=3425126 RepID=UPI003D33DB06